MIYKRYLIIHGHCFLTTFFISLGLMIPHSVMIPVMNFAGTISNAKLSISSHFGASGRSSLPDLCSIVTVFSVSTLNKLPTIYTGIFECQAANAIEKLPTLLYTSPPILIASDHIITISI